MKNKNHLSETLPIDNSYQTGLPLLSGGVFIMKEIKLSQREKCKNKGKYVALVDDGDYEYLNQFRWSVGKSGKILYAIRATRVDGKIIMQFMHGAIMNAKGVDHIDGNGLNNQRSNLRLCTQSENGMNMRNRENTSSIYKGVYFSKSAQKWCAAIKINRKGISLGLFVSELDAAKAYNAKAIELFGEFARLNRVI